jgi:6-pyruvoyltetrahydropterin/6-carboxytetrahydropterin synthase
MYRTGLAAPLAATHILPGGSAGERTEHSHDYRIEVTVAGDRLDDQGYLIDIDLLRSVLASVLDRYQGRCLNGLPEFSSVPPSLENLSREIHRRMSDALAERAIDLMVRVWEDREAWASYEGPPR